MSVRAPAPGTAGLPRCTTRGAGRSGIHSLAQNISQQEQDLAPCAAFSPLSPARREGSERGHTARGRRRHDPSRGSFASRGEEICYGRDKERVCRSHGEPCHPSSLGRRHSAAAVPSCSSGEGYLPRCGRTGEHEARGAGRRLPEPDGFAKAFLQNKEQKD